VTTTTISVVNLKGGSGKTVSAAYVLHVLAELGWDVLGVDADPQQSLLRWHDLGDWAFPVVALPSDRLHRDLPGIAGTRFRGLVVDTPPTEHGKQIALSAARAASHVLVPVAPAPVEYDRLPDVAKLLDEAASLRPDGAPAAEVAVLLVRTIASAASTEVYRGYMADDGWRVLSGEVRRLEQYSQAFGGSVVDAGGSAYGDAVRELLGVER
jgi:chromosome partitioning protein